MKSPSASPAYEELHLPSKILNYAQQVLQGFSAIYLSTQNT